VGLWDVDGTGMRKIEDPNLARAFLNRVNDMNISVSRDAFLVSALFAILPQEVVSSISLCAAFVALLYAWGERYEIEEFFS